VRVARGICLAAAALTVLGNTALAYEVAAVKNGGVVAGVVRYAGEPPSATARLFGPERAACGGVRDPRRDLALGPDAGVRDAVLWLTGIHRGKPFDRVEPVLRHDSCGFVPGVVTLPAGELLEIVRLDDEVHRLRTHGRDTPTVSIRQSRFEESVTVMLEQPEVVHITCDLHPGEETWVAVEAHPYYAVTDEAGGFKLEEVPPGDYGLHLWHRRLGELEQKVVVQPGAETRVDFELVEP